MKNKNGAGEKAKAGAANKRNKKSQHKPQQSVDIDINDSAKHPFPIVGVGSSAGGLEALKKFFSSTPPDSGMAFVLVQHLDPTHESLMVDLLGRYTAMKVVQISNNMPVEPDRIHIIPPNTSLSIKTESCFWANR